MAEMRKRKTIRKETEGQYVHLKECSLLATQPIGSRDVTGPVQRSAAVDILGAEIRCAAANPNVKSA